MTKALIVLTGAGTGIGAATARAFAAAGHPCCSNDGLINNAGIAPLACLEHRDPEE